MIVLVTDSTACLTRAEAREWNVCVVPHSYRLDGNLYTELFEGENGAYAPVLRGSRLRSSMQASEDQFYYVFQALLQRGMDVLCTVISSRLSGAYSAAVNASRRLGSRVAVVDSQLTAGGLYLLLASLRQSIDQEHLSLRQAALRCESIRRHIGVAFSVENMEALRKSRRMGLVRQSVVSMLNRRPVLLLQKGAIVSFGLARGWKERLEKLMEFLPSNVGKVVIQCFEKNREAVALAAEIKRRFCAPLVLLREIGPVLSIHIGEDAIALSWEEKTE